MKPTVTIAYGKNQPVITSINCFCYFQRKNVEVLLQLWCGHPTYCAFYSSLSHPSYCKRMCDTLKWNTQCRHPLTVRFTSACHMQVIAKKCVTH